MVFKNVNHIETKSKFIRNYILFSNVFPRIKSPLIISLIFHGVLLLMGLLTQKENLSDHLNIEIINTPTDMGIKSYSRLSGVKDMSMTRKNSSSKRSILQADPGSLMNSHGKEDKTGIGASEDSFENKYEDILFNRKDTGNSNKRTAKEHRSDLKWDEANKGISHDEKNKTAEKEAIPSGHGESRNVIWRAGYSRKLVFQPEIEYPVYFRKQGIQASVRLIIDVDASGNVVNAEVLQSSGYSKLDILARSGVLKAKFQKRDNFNSNYDRGEVEVQYKLER